MRPAGCGSLRRTSCGREGAVWRPGQGCPVVGCHLNDKLKCLRDLFQFRTHWMEKHEPMVAMYQCPVCSTHWSKRKTHLYQHMKVKHGVDGRSISSSALTCQLWPNKSFVDPAPLTHDIVFGSI